MRNNRIGFKLGAIIMASFLIVLLSLGLVIDRLFTNFYQKEMMANVEQLAAHFTTMAKDPDRSTEHMMGTFAEFSNVSIFYVGSEGHVLAHSGSHNPSDHAFIRPQDVQLLFSGKTVTLEHTDPEGNRYFISGMPLKDGDQIKSALYVLSSTKNMDKSIAAVRNLLILAGIGAFMFALGITWVIAKVLSGPLVQMQRAARKIAAGELETRVNVRSRDETGSLAEAINDLARDLQRYRDTRQEFFAMVSHELRTPITYLEGYARVLKDRLYDSEEEKDKYLDIIHQEALRLQRIVHDLFELSKMEEGKIDLTLESIDLMETAERAVRKVEIKAKEKGLELQLKKEEGVSTIFGDGLRIEQIVLNLLDNAIRYTEKGRILVQVKNSDGRSVSLTVEDTGSGISEEELPYIFDRFYRVEKSRSRQYGGTGLGLAIVKNLVELQGGSISVFSTLHRGTRFEIHFPREDRSQLNEKETS